MRERYIGPDIYRIFCCLGVLIFHVFYELLPAGGVPAKVMYYGASFCVPGFFVLGGYLLSKRKELTVEYLEKKILSLALKLFGWVAFWCLVYFAMTGELPNIVEQYFLGISSNGILPVSWFLFAYIVLLILSYPLYFGLKHKYLKYVVYGVEVILLVILASGIDKAWTKNRPQVLAIHMYLAYFLAGMIISKLEEIVPQRYKKIIFAMAVTSWVLSSGIYWYSEKIMPSLPAYHYGTSYYSIWLISFFVMVLYSSRLNFSDRVKNVLKRIASNTFTIYLGHLPIIMFFRYIIPLDYLWIALAYVVVLFVVLNVFAEIFRKLPIVRKIA